MAQYIKDGQVLDAIQFDGYHYEKIEEFTGKSVDLIHAPETKETWIQISNYDPETIEREVTEADLLIAYKHDWVTKDENGNIGVVSNSEFETT